MFDKFKKVLKYGGLDKEIYDKYEAEILSHDMKNLGIYLAVTCVGFLALGIASLCTKTIGNLNTILYLVTAAVMLVLFFIKLLVMRRSNGKCSENHQILIYIYMALIYAEAIFLTVQNPSMAAVTFIGAMLMLPLLFARRPAGTIVLQITATIVFCCFVATYKDEYVASIDIWNGITFLIISIIEILIVVSIRIKSTTQTMIIKEMSEFDFLTGLKNRNSFENTLSKYSKEKLITVVIYADANGLHEINNNQGHAEGDAMLKAVGGCIQETFGKDYTYRIGGDEFIAICPNEELSWAQEKIEKARDTIVSQGYSISFGCAASSNSDEDINSVIKRAEAKMYSAKADYYKAEGNDRRSR